MAGGVFGGQVTRYLVLGLNRGRHDDWQQRSMVVRQFTTLKGAAPLEHLVRVQSMLASHFGNAGSGLHRQLHNLTLLRNASPAANTTNLAQTRLHHDPIFNRDQDQAPEGVGVRLR